MENFIANPYSKFITGAHFSFTEDGKYYEGKLIGGQDVKVIIAVDDVISEEFVVTCKPVKYDNYYDACMEIAKQVIRK